MITKDCPFVCRYTGMWTNFVVGYKTSLAGKVLCLKLFPFSIPRRLLIFYANQKPLKNKVVLWPTKGVGLGIFTRSRMWRMFPPLSCPDPPLLQRWMCRRGSGHEHSTMHLVALYHEDTTLQVVKAVLDRCSIYSIFKLGTHKVEKMSGRVGHAKSVQNGGSVIPYSRIVKRICAYISAWRNCALVSEVR